MGREPCPLPSALSFAHLCHNPPTETTSTLCPCSFQHVIRGNRPIKTEMAHQLYVLQVLTFNLLEERMMTKMDPNDQVGSQWDQAPPAGVVCRVMRRAVPCVWSACWVPEAELPCVYRNGFVSSVPRRDPFHLCPV